MLSFFLKVSRPGLWFPTIWLYILPLSGQHLWQSLPFFVGLVYITFPLNIMVYGWNDIADQDIDQCNPRKDNYLFGAKGSNTDLARVPYIVLGAQLIFWPILIYLSSWTMLLILMGIVVFCWIYNAKSWGLRTHPPFELACQAGYLLVLPLSCLLNNAPIPDTQVWIYLMLFCIQSQLIGEVMDIKPNRNTGRRTIATELGKQNTKLVIIMLVLLEAFLVGYVIDHYDCVCSFVVCRGDGSESLLACGIPDLQFSNFFIHLQ